METRVRRSSRRRKTVSARMVDGVLELAIPATMSAIEERRWIDEMQGRFARKEAAAAIDLAERARGLAERYSLALPNEITWSERQRTIWGSCTPSRGSIRIATRVSRFPLWVVDYVIIHELAHLSEATHSGAFWELVNRYPASAKARGYLEAKSDGR